MTPKEALQETYRRKEIAEMTAENEVVEYYNTVIEALEKQTPQSAEIIPQDDEGIYKQYICPKCERHLTYGNPMPYDRPHHCRCGQEILWRKE